MVASPAHRSCCFRCANSDLDWWVDALADRPQGDLLAGGQEDDRPIDQHLQLAALSFLLAAIAARTHYVARIVAGASIAWCELVLPRCPFDRRARQGRRTAMTCWCRDCRCKAPASSAAARGWSRGQGNGTERVQVGGPAPSPDADRRGHEQPHAGRGLPDEPTPARTWQEGVNSGASRGYNTRPHACSDNKKPAKGLR